MTTLHVKSKNRWIGVLLMALPGLACGPHSNEAWKVSGHTVDAAGKPQGAAVKFSILTSPAEPDAPNDGHDGVLVSEVNSNSNGAFVTKFSRAQLLAKKQGGFDMRADLSAPRPGQQSYVSFNPGFQGQEDIVLPELRTWDSQGALDASETTLSASFRLPPKAELAAGIKGKLIKDSSPVGTLFVRDAKGHIIWSVATGTQTSVQVPTLVAEEQSATFEVSLKRIYEVEDSGLSVRLDHGGASAALFDRLSSSSFQFPAHVPASRGARCFADGTEVTPCPITDGVLVGGQLMPASKSIVIQLSRAVQPKHILLRDLYLDDRDAQAQVEGSADGVTYFSIGRAVPHYIDLTPTTEISPITFIRITAPVPITNLYEVSVFE